MSNSKHLPFPKIVTSGVGSNCVVGKRRTRHRSNSALQEDTGIHGDAQQCQSQQEPPFLKDETSSDPKGNRLVPVVCASACWPMQTPGRSICGRVRAFAQAAGVKRETVSRLLVEEGQAWDGRRK